MSAVEPIALHEALHRPDTLVLCRSEAGFADPQLAALDAQFSGVDRITPVVLLRESHAAPAIVVRLGATPAESRCAVGQAIRLLRPAGGGASLVVATPDKLGSEPDVTLQAIVEGALLANHRFVSQGTRGPEDAALTRLGLALEPGWDSTHVDAALARANAVAEGALSARDLCTEPGNIMTPPHFVNCMRRQAGEAQFAFSVMDRAEVEGLGMGGLMAVASGSRHDPALVRMDYRANAAPARPVVLVGKTVTFDTGGISIKTAHGMEQMKADMAGGAAVAGAMRAIALLRPELPVTALFPVVENMPGPDAMRPGDVISTHSGKSVEIINTDAEGRLILADAPSYAMTLDPAVIVDLATLTGATMCIFGPLGIGTFSTAPHLMDLMRAADRCAGEKVWELPLWDEYLTFLESPVADLRNFSTSGQMGSTPVAAMFLRQFVGDVPWLHLDLYNTCWSEKPHALGPQGPTGSGTRVLIQFLLLLAQSEWLGERSDLTEKG